MTAQTHPRQRRTFDLFRAAAPWFAILLAMPAWMPATASQPTTIYSIDFDSGSAPGWDFSGEWHVSSCRSLSATHSLGANAGACPPRHGNAGSAAHSPVVDLPAGFTSLNLKFKSWYDLIDCIGGPCGHLLTVSASTDNWQTSTQLYDENEDVNERSWNDRSLDLSTFDGKQVSIGFWIDPVYTGNNGDEGWYIDDLSIESTVTAPPAPKNLDAQRGAQPGEIKLTWEAPAKNGGSAITDYQVWRGNGAGQETFLKSVGVAFAFTDTGIPNGATRFYKVKAVNIEGPGDASNEDSAAAPDVPTSPQAFTVKRGDAVGEIDLTWNAPANNNGLAVTGYRIYRGDQAGQSAFLAEVGDQLSFTDEGIPNGATRFYKVSAINAAGEGTKSAEASAAAPDAPTAPQNPKATRGAQAGKIKVEWQAPASTNGLAVTNYRIYRGEEAGGEEFLVEVGNVLTFTDSGLPNGAKRYYKVSAVNAAGEGPRSAEVSATTPDVPTRPQSPQAIPWIGPGQVRFTWGAPADTGGLAITNYRVYRLDEQVGRWEFVIQVDDVHAYLDGGRKLGSLYHYRATAVNAAGEGPASDDAWAPGTAP